MSWNGSGQRGNSTPIQPKAKKKPSPIRGLIAGGLVVALAVVAVLFFSSSTSEIKRPTKDAKTSRIKDAKMKVVKDVVAKHEEKVEARSATMQRKGAEKAPTAGQSDDAVQLEAAADDNSTAATEKKKSVFVNGTDQLIAMATGVPEGCTIPPLPNITLADTERFIETLKKPIEIDEKDSDVVKAAKERVQTVRDQIAKWMEEEPGKQLGEILNAHRDDFNYTTELHNDVKKGLQEYLDVNDTEGAKHYLTMMNLALQQAGVPEVEMPNAEEGESEEGETNP